MKVADIHAHVFPYKIAEKASAHIGEFYNIALRHIATMENLIEEEMQAGASAFAVCSSATIAAQVGRINDFIAECINPYDNVVGFGSLFPGMEDWEPELERMQAIGIRGVKIHPDFQRVNIDEPSAVEMYRGIAKAGLPVLFHMGDDRFDYSSPRRLTNLLRQVPDLVVIAAHFGGYRAWDEAAVQAFPENVYYDTSSSLVFLGKERALDYLEKLGPDRFLFGSDYPMWTPKLELELFLSLGLDETTRDRILYGNFEKLFLR